MTDRDGSTPNDVSGPDGADAPPLPDQARARARKELAVAVALVVLGAAVALIAGGRSSTTAPGVPAAPGSGGGGEGARALALVALAGAGAVLLVRNRARVVIGAVLLAVAAALVALGVTPTRWSALVAAGLVAAGGVLVVVRARRWPQPRGRYDAPRTRRTGTPKDTWDALDRGEDPTA